MSLLEYIINNQAAGKGMLAQLIDPDDVESFDQLADTAVHAEANSVDFLLVGGSLITRADGFDVVAALKQVCQLPIVTFPSTPMQLHPQADGLLLLSLISGRNPDYLIGHHVHAAPLLRNMACELLPTGYMLVDCGSSTTAQYISHSQPMPYHKPDIAAATALAGEQLGLRLLYLDGGSGAVRSISPEMVKRVRSWTSAPLLVGGGITTAEKAAELYAAGANVLVVGTAAWKNPEFVRELSALKNTA